MLDIKIERLRGLEQIKISSMCKNKVESVYFFNRAKVFNLRTTHEYIETFVRNNYKQSVITKINQTDEYTIIATIMTTAPDTL